MEVFLFGIVATSDVDTPRASSEGVH